MGNRLRDTLQQMKDVWHKNYGVLQCAYVQCQHKVTSVIKSFIHTTSPSLCVRLHSLPCCCCHYSSVCEYVLVKKKHHLVFLFLSQIVSGVLKWQLHIFINHCLGQRTALLKVKSVSSSLFSHTPGTRHFWIVGLLNNNIWSQEQLQQHFKLWLALFVK